MLRICVVSTAALGQAVGQVAGPVPGQPGAPQVGPDGQPIAQGEQPFRPVTRVINLLKDMQTQVEKERKEDQELYEKMQCWCKQNDEQKSKAIDEYNATIERLVADIERFSAKSAQLTQEIKNLEQEIARNQSSMMKATSIREEEANAFAAEKSDMLETIDALEKALQALGGVHGEGGDEKAAQAFVQLKSHLHHIKRSTPKMFADLAEKDLWDALGSIDEEKPKARMSATQVLSEVFMAPVQKHDEAKTNLVQAPMGAVAAKSYNARSGQIFGMLKEMKDEFNRKLDTAEKEEQMARETFAKLKKALLEQIAAATEAKNQKSSELATTNLNLANAKQDLTNTREALDEDTKFLANLRERCTAADKEYNARQKTRGQEVVALNEAIGILSEDSFRETANKVVNFIELTSKQGARYNAAAAIRAMARKHKNMNLAQLAVSVKLDGFERVKKAMDEMLAGLKKQQEDEYQHREWCMKELDTNEDTIADQTRHKEDVESEIQDLENFIDTTKNDIKDLHSAIAELNQQLKRSSMDREAENKEFRTTVNDQRATKQILNKALVRLEKFYQPERAQQVAAASVPNQVQPVGLVQNRPGFSKDNKAAPMQATYEKHGSATGVLGLLREIIADTDRMEAEATTDENAAQKAYEEFTRNTNQSVNTHQNSITSKEGQLAEAEVKLSAQQDDLANTNDQLAKLKELNGNLHSSCDFVMKNYEVRQTARQEEMDSIVQAKAILSGAK